VAARCGHQRTRGEPLQHVFTRFDGKGVPGKVGGDDIALSMRLFHLADTVEVHHRTSGTDAAVDVARSRRGKHFYPTVVDGFCEMADEVLGDPADEPDWRALVDGEPSLQHRLTERELDNALEDIAGFTHLRSAPRSCDSRAVADLAGRAAAERGLPDVDIAAVRRAGLVHDIGLHGIPDTILDNAGALSTPE